MKHFSEQELAAGFARLRQSVAGRPAASSELRRPERNARDAEPGDLWVVGTARADESGPDEPLWMLLLEKTAHRHAGGAVWRGAPVFAEVELATGEDAVLPRRVLGGRAAFAFGCEAPVPAAGFRRFVGALPDEWFASLLDFRTRLESGSRPLPEGLQIGLPPTHPDHPALAFHESLLARLESIMHPVLREALAPARAAVDLAPVFAASEWLRGQWSRMRNAGGRIAEEGAAELAGFAEWARRFVLPLGRPLEPAPVTAGFRADDGLGDGEAETVECRLPQAEALVLLVRETPARAEWRLQVLEDPRKALEGAAMLGPDGTLLARIKAGLSSEPFLAEDGWVAIRLTDGSFAEIELPGDL